MTVGNLKPVLGTQFSDGLDGNNLEIVYGLKGNDDLSPNYELTANEPVILLGGEGDDTYYVSDNSFAVILETGNSNGDSIYAPGYKINGENTYSLTIDNRHLYTADLDTSTYALILDWRSNTAIDKFAKFELYDGTFTFQEATAFFDDLVASGNDHFLGDFTWNEVQTDPLLVANGANLDLSRLGLSSDTINAAIEKVKATEARFQATITSLTPDDDLANPALTKDDNSYIFNTETYYYDLYSIEQDLTTVSDLELGDDLTENLMPGDIVNINLSSDAFAPMLFILDSKGNVIHSDQSGNLTFAVGSDEPFFISVESRSAEKATGSYDLSVDILDEEIFDTDKVDAFDMDLDLSHANQPIVVFDSIGTPESISGSLDTNDIINADLDNGSFLDIYSLTGASVGQAIKVTLDADFDGAITITAVDSNFQIVEDKSFYVDDNLNGNLGSEQATFTVESGLDYFVRISNVAPQDIGSYTVATEII
jgi:hypothetical protein